MAIELYEEGFETHVPSLYLQVGIINMSVLYPTTICNKGKFPT